MTSAMTMAVLPLVNVRRMLQIGPTVSSDELSGVGDRFPGVMTPSSQEAVSLARVAYTVKGAGRVFVFFDSLPVPAMRPSFVDSIAGSADEMRCFRRAGP
jgi:ABC-type branched-subunit amino acid transport system substrate-binding protein